MRLEEVVASRECVDAALDRYASFAKASAWSVEHKFELYAHARNAWDAVRPKDARLREFRYVLNALISDWQIARPGVLSMDPESIFDTLESHVPVRRMVRPSEDLQAAFGPIESLRNLKHARTSWRSPMALSKVLHFFNPRIYPIYDNRVVEGIVLKRFRQEWATFEPTVRLTVSWPHTGAIYYLKYMLWCEHIISIGGDTMRAAYASWISRFSAPHATKAIEEDLEAAAFEMIAIGAAHLQDRSG